MKKLRTLSYVALICGIFGVAGAQNLDMQGTAPGADDGRPTRGMTQASVESKYGAPVAKNAAVGEPPISSWEYQTMIVYFEYDRVVHAVKKR
jgi:hypothetical protein